METIEVVGQVAILAVIFMFLWILDQQENINIDIVGMPSKDIVGCVFAGVGLSAMFETGGESPLSALLVVGFLMLSYKGKGRGER